MNHQHIRTQFPATNGRVYLDTASYGPGPMAARKAVESWVAEWSDGTAHWRSWDSTGDRCRSLFGSLMGAEAERIALLPSMSVAAAQVASSAKPGQNIVVGREEFRSNFFPWSVQSLRGVEVREVPFHAGGPDLQAMGEAIDDQTTLVAVSHVQSASGIRVPLEPLVEACRGRAARLFLDATQSAGALRIPLEGVDYLATAAYKWLCAPKGTALLYVSPGLEEELVPYAPGWKGVQDPYSNYYGGPFVPADGAERFDTALAWIAWTGLERSLELLCEVGIDSIEAHDLALAERFRAGLSKLGLEAARAEVPSPIVGVSVPDVDAVIPALKREHVVAAVRGDFLRFSFHLFNDDSDVDRALAALAG